jgi:DnaD/phage-associated family protein
MRTTPIPAPFFSELLPEIDSLAELKVTLYMFWALDRQEGDLRYVSFENLVSDQRLLTGLGRTHEASLTALADGLERAVGRGTLLVARLTGDNSQNQLYFINTPRGRAAFEALRKGEWAPDGMAHSGAALDVERPNIYRLYEENIGPLTPMIADMLRDAEQLYPPAEIEEALRIAVQNNARNWRYIESILQAWQAKGGRGESNRRDSEKNSGKYYEGEFGEFVEH